jgi:hypothetical protein
MNKLSKEKRNQLILVIVLTLVVLGGLFFGLVRYQYRSLAELADKKQAEEKRVHEVETAIKRAGQLEAEWAEVSKKLAAIENSMASGDLNFWANETIRRFKLSYRVEIPQVGHPAPADNVALLPRFPYKQAIFNVQGTAYYHDLGRFLADFENEFPHFRVLNLEIGPASSLAPGEKEKLSFKMDIVILVKPNPA